MWSDSRTESIYNRVKDELNKEKIKLWLDPYYNEKTGVGDEQEQSMQILCQQIVEKLNIDQEECIKALKDLQNQALDRLKSNQVFKTTGIASIRVKVSGEVPMNFSVNILLSVSTEALIEEVAGRIDIPPSRIKLISGGKVLKQSESLEAQGVKNSTQLMAVILAADNDRLEEAEKRFKTLENTKKDVKLLAGRSSQNNQHYLQIENQAGEMINLPYHEHKAVVTAITLHEKGRAALKKKDYSLALVLFLEADKDYSECTSELLKSVDNYALLHLDIAWCYLCLRNPAQIPDADRRLGLCEQNFHISYGPNLERLIAIKGTTGSEAALFMRLHLLQGVVAFYQNKRAEAKALLERAQQELIGLKVDDNSLCLLLELGYSSSEARLALRCNEGNIELAEEFIHRRRNERENARERNRLKLQKERESISLGLCADKKQYCDPEFVNQLVAMGFDRSQGIAALKMSNNIISEAINILQDQPHLLPSCSRNVNEESVIQLASLGISPDVAREALEMVPQLEETVRLMNSLSQSDLGGQVAASATVTQLMEEFCKKHKKKENKELEAFKRVSEDLIDNDSDSHLDLNLAEEEQFLAEYLSLLN